MKAIKIIGLSLMTFALAGTATAQRDSGSSSTTIATPEYFKDVKTLQTYFASGEIPGSFPKYDSSLDKVGNQELVKTWVKVPANYELLSQLGKDKFKASQSKPRVQPMEKK